jgi:anti-sigma factor RsiW
MDSFEKRGNSPRTERERGGSMEITREVVLDLLPLYITGEVSDDTKNIVEMYLAKDPSLAASVEHATASGLNEIPIPLSQEVMMENYKKANKMMVIRTLGLAVIIAGTLLTILLVLPLMYLFIF